MPNKIVKNVSLFFREGTSDKQYNIHIIETDKGHLVHGFNGRRGGTLKVQNKTLIPVSLGAAQQIFDKLYKDKTRKGYTEGEATDQSFQ